MTKQLYRSTEHKQIAGVLGGLGEYFNVDANAVRLIYTLLTVFTGFFPGIITYVLATLIVPSRGTPSPSEVVKDGNDSSEV